MDNIIFNMIKTNKAKVLFFLSLSLLMFSCTSYDSVTKKVIGDHLSEKAIVYLDSDAGQKLYKDIDQSKFKNLKKYWTLQRKSYCGVCSSVIVTNTIKNKKEIDQDSFFSKGVNKIIGPEIVGNIGLTLREITLALKKHHPSMSIEKFPANISGYDLLIDQLEKFNKGKSFSIVNFSINSLKGKGMNRGHFSIISGYHHKSKRVLILEVNSKKHYWVKTADLYTAMLAVDPISRMPRGWLTLSMIK